jgi:hypothetical protein
VSVALMMRPPPQSSSTSLPTSASAEGPGAGQDESPTTRVESDWFEPGTRPPPPAYEPGHEWEDRRGWRPPRPTQGLWFAAISFVLIGAAIGGSIFFLTPELDDDPSPRPVHRAPEPATSASTTNAEVPLGAADSEPTMLIGDKDPPEAGARAKPPPPRAPVWTPPPKRAAPPPPAPRPMRPEIRPERRRPESADELFDTPSGMGGGAHPAPELRDPP